MQVSFLSTFSFPLFVFLWLSLLFLRLPAETSSYFHTKPEHLGPWIFNGNLRYLFPVYSIGLYSRLPIRFTCSYFQAKGTRTIRHIQSSTCNKMASSNTSAESQNAGAGQGSVPSRPAQHSRKRSYSNMSAEDHNTTRAERAAQLALFLLATPLRSQFPPGTVRQRDWASGEAEEVSNVEFLFPTCSASPGKSDIVYSGSP